LPYCQPPALCPDCWEKHGKGRGVHADCKEGARKSQEREDSRARALAAGRYERRTAWGSWHEAVPDGKTGVAFIGNQGTEYRLLPAAQYNAHDWLDEFPAGSAEPWPNHPGSTTKQTPVVVTRT
jgi:hypothetical protein